jgi:hypothetical protein
MPRIHIVEERAPYLLLASGDRFAVVERRNGQFFALRSGERVPAPATPSGAEAVVGDDWQDEAAARQQFEEIVTRYKDLEERIW